MAIVVSPDGKFLYISTGRGNSIAMLNADSLELLANIPVGERTWGMAVSKDGKYLYSADGISGTVSVVDTEKQQRIDTIDVGAYPWGVALDD